MSPITASTSESGVEKFQNLISQAPVLIATFIGPSFIVETVNKMALNIWCKSYEEVINKPLFESSPELEPGLKNILNNIYLTGQPFISNEIPVELKRSGETNLAYFNSIYQPLLDADKKIYGIILIGTEITEAVNARKEIEKSELLKRTILEEKEKIASHFKLATDSAKVGVWSLDVQTQQLEWSKLHKKMWGYDEHRTDLTFEDWHSIILTEDKASAFKKLEEARVNRSLYEVEYRIKRPNDNIIRWMRAVGHYYYNDAGEAITLTGISLDITEQKTFTEELENKVRDRTKELDLKSKQLEELNTTLDLNIIALENANAELKSFNYIASHDLQEPLRMIKMFTQRILDTEKLSEKTQGYFNIIVSASERMRNLIISLIDFSKIDKSEAEFVDCNLNTVIEESKNDLQVVIAETNARIEYDDLPTVSGMQIQLCQLFTNLIANAIKYSKPQIDPHIKITSALISGQEINQQSINKEQDYYAIKIADNGIGFEKEYNSKIFDVFQRLHGRDEYAGTGIGLAIVYKIMTNHNGIIIAEGQPNVGATFTLYLPVEL